MAPCLLPKISGVKVTPSVTSVESSEKFWRKIRQIWRICEPCGKVTLMDQQLSLKDIAPVRCLGGHRFESCRRRL